MLVCPKWARIRTYELKIASGMDNGVQFGHGKAPTGWSGLYYERNRHHSIHIKLYG